MAPPVFDRGLFYEPDLPGADLFLEHGPGRTGRDGHGFFATDTQMKY